MHGGSSTPRYAPRRGSEPAVAGARQEQPGAEREPAESAVAGARLDRPGAEPRQVESEARVEAVAQGGSCAPRRMPRRSSKPTVPRVLLRGIGCVSMRRSASCKPESRPGLLMVL